MSRIDSFDGQYRFLSNYWPCIFTYQFSPYKTRVCKSVEHAYQALKATTDEDFELILNQPTANAAKQKAKKIALRKDWEEVKLNIMYELVLEKFRQNPDLTQLLKETGEAELVEGNWWGDTFWGVCNGVGDNNLGKILMRVRGKLL